MGLFGGSRPDNLGAVNGVLARCKASPNCISSQAQPQTDPGHYIEPLQAGSNPLLTWEALKRLLAELPRVNLVQDHDGYLYAEFSTPLMGFVDDVEFFASAAEGVVHVRSSSRLGRRDFGVNRERVEAIRARFGAARSGARQA